jgi:hypothetical protein
MVGPRIRRTFSNMETILILDPDNAKMLTLDPETRGAAYVDIEGPLQEGTKSYLIFVRDVVIDLENRPDIPVEKLGQKEVDGRKVVGFLVSDQDTKLTIWADPKTALPIRIEILQGQVFTVLKNIEFDVPVDKSLVSMDIPVGYTMQETEINMREFTVQDFIESLRIRAELLLNGKFPENISAEDFLKLTPVVEEKIGQLDLPEQEKVQLGMRFVRGGLFIQLFELKGEGKWHYAGKGVKLGDAEKAIFWYRPKGSETYRIIYGDLSVRDAAPEDLPE